MISQKVFNNIMYAILVCSLVWLAFAMSVNDNDTTIIYYDMVTGNNSIPIDDNNFKLGCLNLCVDKLSIDTYKLRYCLDYCRGKNE